MRGSHVQGQTGVSIDDKGARGFFCLLLIEKKAWAQTSLLVWQPRRLLKTSGQPFTMEKVIPRFSCNATSCFQTRKLSTSITGPNRTQSAASHPKFVCSSHTSKQPQPQLHHYHNHVLTLPTRRLHRPRLRSRHLPHLRPLCLPRHQARQQALRALHLPLLPTAPPATVLLPLRQSQQPPTPS